MYFTYFIIFSLFKIASENCVCFFDRHLYSIETDLSTGSKRKKICWWKSGTLINWFCFAFLANKEAEFKMRKTNRSEISKTRQKKNFSYLYCCRNVIITEYRPFLGQEKVCRCINKPIGLCFNGIFSTKSTEKQTKKYASSLRKTIDI